MPADDRVWSDDHERVFPTVPPAAEHGPEQAIGVRKTLVLRRSVEHDELMSQRQVLQHQVATRAEERENQAGTALTRLSMASRVARPGSQGSPGGWVFARHKAIKESTA
jgi:hypothetical protein